MPSTSVNWPAGEFIYRARYHDSDRVPQTVSDISYPPKERCTLGRANFFEEQVFYGMLPSGDPHARLACYHEVASHVQPVQTFTMSRWRVKKQIENVLSLVMHPNQANDHELARRCYEHTMEYLRALPLHIQSKALTALHKTGKEFSSEVEDCNYWWQATFAHHVFHNQGFKAILYPSVPYKYRMMCIAMPASIANEHLEPVYGTLFQLHHIDGRMREVSYKEFHVEGNGLIWRDDITHQPGFVEYARSTVPRNCSPCEMQRDRYLRYVTSRVDK